MSNVFDENIGRKLSSEDLLAAASNPRFAVLAQLDTDIASLIQLDEKLLRDPRLLVPVDLNALVVRGGGEPMVRLPFRTSSSDTPPNPDDAGSARPDGIHLLWTVPAAFGRGIVVPDPAAPDDTSRNTLSLPPLPDRWVVLRICVPIGAARAHVRGWVLRAEDGNVVDLPGYPTAAGLDVGPAVPAEQLNAHVGGPGWMESYDAALGRLAFHDPLDDLDAIAPDGVENDAMTYVVAGWWEMVQHDPLDGVGSIFGYADRLAQLGWDDPDHPAPERKRAVADTLSKQVEATLGLTTAERYTKTSASQNKYRPQRSGFVNKVSTVASIDASPTRATLLHGRLHGVPYRGAAMPDDRPAVDRVGVAVGPTSPSVSALLASGAMVDATTPSQQADAERLLTAFQSGLLARISEPDTWAEIEHYEHLQGFGSIPGGTEAVDRFRIQSRPGNDPGSGNRLGRRSRVQYESISVDAAILWSTEKYIARTATGKASSNNKVALTSEQTPAISKAVAELGVRSSARPAVPYSFPVSPVLGVTGCGRRIRAAERDEADGLLRVRTADQIDQGSAATVRGRDLLSSIGSGAVPDETLALAREAMIADPYLVAWRAAHLRGDDRYRSAGSARLHSEAAISYAYYAGHDDMLSKATGARINSSSDRQVVLEGLLKHSGQQGVWCHSEGVTMWGQPWRPQFCEWTVTLQLADLAELLGSDESGWRLEEHDLERVGALVGADAVTLTGRSPLHTGIAKGLAAAVAKWVTDERARDEHGQGVASDDTEKAMADIQRHLSQLDVLSITLDGVREQLLGLRYDRGLVHDDADVSADGTPRALATGLPRLVAAGRIGITSARLVDSWGRLLVLPLERAAIVARAADPDAAVQPSIQLMPRITTPSRVHLRLVDPLEVDGTAQTAVVDQVDATLMVNPVAGFLLPDHIDEALEMFDTAGVPLGQLSHDAFSDAVFWEGAPGRTDIGAAAGPLDDPDPGHRRLGWIGAGLVNADAELRQGAPGRPETESPLSALLRAIDTTLWTVDPFGAMGTEHIAGLVGRPIAVVQAELTLDVPDDLDQVVYAAGTSREDRARSFAELAAVPFAVRLGSLIRSDDGLLGYFVDDDYRRVHVIDRQVTQRALDSGRCRGELGVTGESEEKVIDNDYVVDAGYITVRVGQTRRLTLLVHPGGKVHVSSGIAPRSSVALARDWIQPGLSVMAPSVRVGPLLIDADKVRLPKISSFPADQLFTRRLEPGAWRDDPILAATQSAYLPDQPSMLQEGWIRVNPDPSSNGTTT